MTITWPALTARKSVVTSHSAPNSISVSLLSHGASSQYWQWAVSSFLPLVSYPGRSLFCRDPQHSTMAASNRGRKNPQGARKKQEASGPSPLELLNEFHNATNSSGWKPAAPARKPGSKPLAIQPQFMGAGTEANPPSPVPGLEHLFQNSAKPAMEPTPVQTLLAMPSGNAPPSSHQDPR